MFGQSNSKMSFNFTVFRLECLCVLSVCSMYVCIYCEPKKRPEGGENDQREMSGDGIVRVSTVLCYNEPLMNIHISNLIDILAAAQDNTGQHQVMVHNSSSHIKELVGCVKRTLLPLWHVTSWWWYYLHGSWWWYWWWWWWGKHGRFHLLAPALMRHLWLDHVFVWQQYCSLKV